jgi:hypothetical protein
MKKYLFYISQNYSFSILRPIQEILRQRGDEVYWFFEGSEVNPDYLNKNENLIPNVKELMKYKADATLAPAQSIPSFLPGLKVAIFHGFNVGKLDRRGKNDHFKLRGCFDLYCTQGPDTTQPFKAFQQKHPFFNVIETGWCALDPLFCQNTSSRKKSSDKPTILFCSTFSKRLTCAKTLLPTIHQLSKTGKWQWLVQFHPKMDPEVIQQYKAIQNKNLEYIETDNVIPLLQQADAMLCDTSSVIPMFLLLNKPVVTFNNISPGNHLLNIHNPGELQQNIQYALTRPEQLMRNIAKHNRLIHPYHDGLSSQRVVKAIDDVLAGKYPVTEKPPTNFIRNFKYRKRLKYWKFW